MKTVEALNWKGTTLSMFGIMPKFKVICGECKLLFKERIHGLGEIYLKCPHCGTINDLGIEVS
jgi:hypothetical protein